jgi:hypothetical protein
MSVGSPSQKHVVEEALRGIGALFEPGDVIEIRALAVGRSAHHAGRIYAGYFNFESERAIVSAINSVDGKGDGVYVVLNRLNPDLVARSDNRLQAGLKNTTTDADIIQRRWLYIDADAVKPAGISATDAEHEAALERIQRIREFLSEGGWPEPIVADSGNGGHLLYRLPPMEMALAGDFVRRCLRSLSERFSDTTVRVDEATANASRICKLYGTLVRKGDSTADRPHRRSRLIETPEQIIPVSQELLQTLADEVAPAARATATGSSYPGAFDIDQWLTSSGLEIVNGPEPYNGGRRWTLRHCPFNPLHERPVIIQLAQGALSYTCLHKSCAENRWRELRRLIDPDYYDGGQRSSAGSVGSRVSEEPNRLITDVSQIPSVFSMESQLEWCIEGMIPEGSITMICAESGTGKTWVGYSVAGYVAHGLPLLGLRVVAKRVLYLDGENPLCVAKQRLYDLGIRESPNLTVWGGWNLSPPVGPQNPVVIDYVRQHKPLLVYDSLIEFHPGSEQSSTETRAFMRHFRALTNLGATVLILHHTGKAETSKLYRGSSDIKAAVDTAYLLARNNSDTQELTELSMTCFKARFDAGRNFGMRFERGRGFFACDAFRPTRSVREVIAEILESTPDLNQTEIVAVGVARGCGKRQIETCLKTGAWKRKRGPKNSTLYSLGDASLEGADE